MAPLAWLLACSSNPPPVGQNGPTGGPTAVPSGAASSEASPNASASAAAGGSSAQLAASGAPSAQPAAGGSEPSAGGNSSFVAHIEEAKAAQDLGPAHAKLLQIAKLSPKTHKSLLKSFLWKGVSECKDTKLVDVQPAPGILGAPGGKGAKVRSEVYDHLKAAGALAKQRGLSIEVLSGHMTIKDAVNEWNEAILDKALALIKLAPPADQKEKSFAGEARKALGTEGPKTWGESACDVGRTAGWSVKVQLVTLDASGARGSVLVKGGPDSDKFTPDAFESTYWDKKKGKNYRTLTEIMSAGSFVRQCSDAALFMTSPKTDGSWRCKEDTESWDPPNRPIPAWQ